ncbi:Ig-like domain-containing protein [Prevotella sp. 10(H)]|uniref:Ig-like domain-containing protein n=1 Tax=Prevotella sp. 10(H) TaxID=1158294 RepID=UPI00068D56F8|nr:Ig-like domain-containing protein [Prevotella sp. 10(H)]
MNKLLFLLSLVFSFTLFTACGSDDEKEHVILTSLKINQPDKDLYIGDKYQLTTIHEPSNIKLPELIWKSSDTKVATVSNTGELTAIADGMVTISASYGDLISSINIAILKKQDYTSFVFVQSADVVLPNCVAAYKKDNKYYKLGELGNLSKGMSSAEIPIEDKSITEIYFFTDYNGCVRTDFAFVLIKDTKNIFALESSLTGIRITDKSDPTQYPQ